MSPVNPVLVAGAGAAGLASALAAAESGADVVLIERSPHFQKGSNTAMSTAMIPAAGSRWQQEAGIDDSPERFEADMVDATGGQTDPVVARALTTVAPELVAWLVDHCGVTLNLVTDFRYPGHSAQRCHTVPDRSGRSLHKQLLDAVGHCPNIEMLKPMELSAVRTDGENVTAKLTSPDGTSEWAEVSSVILATNGFGANGDLIAKYIPEMTDAYYHGGDGSRGDAILIGETLGADMSALDAYQGHGSLAMPHAVLLTWAVVMHGGVIVNNRGERFADESLSYSSFGAKVAAQPESVGWVIFDTTIGSLCESFADYQDILSAKSIHTADTLEELAAIVGCESAVLRTEMAAVDAVRTGNDTDRFGRTEFEHRIEAPLLAVKVTGALFHTQGGLVVDGSARVLRAGQPIPGIYAAGGAAVGVSGHGSAGYLAGNGLLAALGLGYLAGRDAAARP